MNSKIITNVTSKVLLIAVLVYYNLSGINGNTAYAVTAFTNGTGTVADPYIVSTPEQLNEVRYHLDKHFKQDRDIDLSDYTNWEPIGALHNEFTGSYDGNGHIITDLSIDRNNQEAVGLFGYVKGTNGGIRNLGIENANVIGLNYVGILVGQYYGTGGIEKCYSIGNVEGNDFIGNLVGMNATSIFNCYSYGTVIGHDYIGGLTGQNFGGILSNCYSVASVYGNSMTGGLVGISNDDYYIQNCFYNKEVAMQTDTSKGSPLSTNEMKHSSSFFNYDFTSSIWMIYENYSFPQLSWETPWRDTTQPVITSLSPQSSMTGVVIGTDLAMDFDRNIYRGYGVISVSDSSNTIIETIDVRSNQVSVSGQAVTIDIDSTSLQYDTEYHINVESSCFKNSVGLFFDGIYDSSTWVFRTQELIIPDTIPPMPPNTLTASQVTPSGLQLTWTEPSDNVGVTGYDIYLDTMFVGSTTDTSYGISGLNPNSTYRFTVVAKDAAGNVSPPSNQVKVTTQETPKMNHIPTVGTYKYSTKYETLLSDQLVAYDVDNDLLSYSMSVGCQHGMLVLLKDGAFSYTPVQDFSGKDEFKVLIDDGNGGVVQATVEIDVKQKVTTPTEPT
ncbi:MAG TPA: cadherin-like domain-containing protein, partial [Lachnospiraceae bacterium]|nr:cadherin-like domain-containing protein [Lachnospiraceae bacterium]